MLPLILPVFFKAGAAEISAAISESAGKSISGSLIAVSLCITCSANQPFLLWVTNICTYPHICTSMQKKIKIAQTKFSQAFGWFLFQLVVELSPHLPGLRSHWYRRRNAAPGAQTRDIWLRRFKTIPFNFSEVPTVWVCFTPQQCFMEGMRCKCRSVNTLTFRWADHHRSMPIHWFLYCMLFSGERRPATSMGKGTASPWLINLVTASQPYWCSCTFDVIVIVIDNCES